MTVAGSLANPVGITGWNVFHFPEYDREPAQHVVRVRRARRRAASSSRSDLDPGDLRYGTVALATTDARTTAKPQWLSGFWQDGVQVFWDDLRADGRLEPEIRVLARPSLRTRTGSPGCGSARWRSTAGWPRASSTTSSSCSTWHFPNRPRAWQGNIGLDGTNADETVRNHYATRFDDAVGGGAAPGRRPVRTSRSAPAPSTGPCSTARCRPRSSTRSAPRSSRCAAPPASGWPTGGSPPGRAASTTAAAAKAPAPTCGTTPRPRRTCSPRWSADARRTEFLHETRPDGRMNFRANSVFDNAPWDFHPGRRRPARRDRPALPRVAVQRRRRVPARSAGPAARRALEYAFTRWDADGDAVLDSRAAQHVRHRVRTAPNSLANSMFFAALRAGRGAGRTAR